MDHPTYAVILTPEQRRRGLTAVIASAAVAGVVIGLFNPLLALKLERMGVDTTWNGVIAAMPAIAAIAATPFLPGLTARIGLLRTLLLGVALIAAITPLFALFTEVWVWFVLRFIMGIGGMMHWVTSEIWINAAVRDEHRGRVIGAYGALFSVGMACGPLILGVIGTEGALPFYASTGIVTLCALPMVFAFGAAPAMHRQKKGAFVDACRRAPTPMMASLIVGALWVATFALLPLYALRSGITETAAITMLSVIVAGQIVASVPIGWLADRMDRRLLLIAFGVVAFLCSLLLPALLASNALLMIMLFVWGSASAGIYTLSIVRLGEIFEPGDLGPATAVYLLMTQIGGVVGPIAGGAGMDAWDPHGLVVVFALSSGLFCVFAGWRYAALRRGPAAANR